MAEFTNTRHAAAGLFAVLVVLAGCSLISDDSTPGTTSTPTPSTASPTATPAPPSPTDEAIRVYGEPLPFDATLVWKRVQEIHGTDVPPPSAVYVEEGQSPNVTASSFQELMGMAAPEDPSYGRGAGGRVAPGSRQVYIVTRNDSADGIEHVLAHEYAHSIQYAHGLHERLLPREPSANTNRFAAYRLVAEGGAEYVEDVYATTYLGYSTYARTRERYEQGSAFERHLLAPYYHGPRYVRHRVDSPRGIEGVYENPPNTTEQVLHNYTASEEPPRSLHVAVTRGDSPMAATGNETKGELFLRIALTTELNDSEAARAADGWGTDRLFAFRKTSRDVGTPEAYAWALRWDNATEAGEFENAFRTYLDRRATERGGLWYDGGAAFRLERASGETVVVFAGAPPFVSNASAAGTRGNVTVALGG